MNLFWQQLNFILIKNMLLRLAVKALACDVGPMFLVPNVVNKNNSWFKIVVWTTDFWG